MATGQVETVAEAADAPTGAASEHAADAYIVEPGSVDGLRGLVANELQLANQGLLAVLDVGSNNPAGQAVSIALAHGSRFAARDLDTCGVATVIFGDDDVLGDVYQTTGEVA